MLKVDTYMKQGILIVKIDGELDVCGANEFRTYVDEALDMTEAKHILLDMQDVGFIDSSGVGAILGRYKRIAQNGGKLFVVNLEPHSKRIFELAGLLKVLTVYQSEEQALELL